jgi:RNA polymerase sigma-70 factor (ECF subfamily)
MSSDDKIEQAYAKAKTLWPDVATTLDEFREASARVGVHDFDACASDLFLSCAAGRGDAVAIQHIDERFIATLTGRIRRLGASSDEIADVLQVVRERLFTGSSPRIRTYNATVSLSQWIKVIAIRAAIDAHRREALLTKPPMMPADSDVPDPHDMQTHVMKEEYRHEFEKAVRELLVRLETRDRIVLRLYILEHVSIDKIAGMYGVHRVTVTRWIWNAGEHLLAGLREHFRHRFGIELREFDSLARLVRSRLSLDLDRVLGSAS